MDCMPDQITWLKSQRSHLDAVFRDEPSGGLGYCPVEDDEEATRDGYRQLEAGGIDHKLMVMFMMVLARVAKCQFFYTDQNF